MFAPSHISNINIHRHIFPLRKKKKISGFENTFFSFHLRCCKNENLWWFSPYPVNTTIIWPTTDRIPHFLIFKRMQIKWIADNIRAFSFLLTNWYKEPHEERKSKKESWTIRSEKCARAHVQQNKTIYLSIYLSIWKPFWKRVYI